MRYRLSISLLLLVAVWAAPHATANEKSSSDTGSAQTATETTGSQITLEGCLGGKDGKYNLTDDHGNIYALTGDPAKLSEHMGKEVQITGTSSTPPGGSGDAASSGASRSGNQSQAIEVTSVRPIANRCRNTLPVEN